MSWFQDSGRLTWRTLQRAAVGFSRQSDLEDVELKFAAAR